MRKRKKRKLFVGMPHPIPQTPRDVNAMQFSGKFAYELCKQIDGLESEGTSGLWAARVSKGYGSCPERFCPRETDTFPISKQMLEKAYAYRIPAYERLFSLNDIKKVLILTEPAVVLGFDEFRGIRDALGGYVPMPGTNEDKIDAHCVCVFGYDDGKRVLMFRNSWGIGWGNKGNGYLPYDYLDKYAIECWSTMDWRDWVNYRQNLEESKFSDKNGATVRSQLHKIQSMVLGRSPLHVLDLFGADTKICGWALFSMTDNGNALEIEDIFILPPYRHLGLGTKLLESIQNVARSYIASEITGWVAVQDIVPEEKEVTIKSYFAKAGFELTLDTEKFRGSYWRVTKRVVNNIFLGVKGEPNLIKLDGRVVPPSKPDALLADVVQKGANPFAIHHRGGTPDTPDS